MTPAALWKRLRRDGSGTPDGKGAPGAGSGRAPGSAVAPVRAPGECLRCGSCEEVCPEDAVRLGPTGPRIDRARCSGCLDCVAACESGILVAPGS